MSISHYPHSAVTRRGLHWLSICVLLSSACTSDSPTDPGAIVTEDNNQEGDGPSNGEAAGKSGKGGATASSGSGGTAGASGKSSSGGAGGKAGTGGKVASGGVSGGGGKGATATAGRGGSGGAGGKTSTGAAGAAGKGATGGLAGVGGKSPAGGSGGEAPAGEGPEACAQCEAKAYECAKNQPGGGVGCNPSLGCEQFGTKTAAEGDQAGALLKDLCLSLRACMVRSNCAEYGTTDCLCGQFGDSSECAGTPFADVTGVCKAEIANAAETDVTSTIITRFANAEYAVGAATNLTDQCDVPWGCSQTCGACPSDSTEPRCAAGVIEPFSCAAASSNSGQPGAGSGGSAVTPVAGTVSIAGAGGSNP